MKIYETLKKENIGKIYYDDTISEEWKVVSYESTNREEDTVTLETLEDREDIKDYWDLTMQEILEMEFEEEI